MHKSNVFSPLYTIYSILFVFYFGCLCIVKCRYPLKIVSILTQLNNSEYMKRCIYCLYIVQFRNYIRARVNALLIGHVTPPLWTQPCFECTEIFSWLTFLLCRTVLNAKKVADEK